MGTLTQVHREALTRLQAVLPAFLGPANDLPTVGGKVVQCAVLWPTAGSERVRANTGRATRADRLRIVCVGSTTLDALAAAGRVRTALTGVRLTASATGGVLLEDGFTHAEPQPEPGTDPLRVSLTLEYNFQTKDIV